MKRIIIMLLIVSSAVATAQAQQKIYANTPQQDISQLEYMINMYGLTFASPHESLAGDVVYGLQEP